MIDRAWLKSVLRGARLVMENPDQVGSEVSPALILECAAVREPRSEAERLMLLGVATDAHNNLAAAREPGAKLGVFLAYLREHSRDPTLTRTRVARAIGVSDSWLAHHLKATTGRSFTVHLDNLRLADVQRLLRHSDESIKHVALTAGFRSGHALGRLFKRRLGVSPTTWRRQGRRAQGAEGQSDRLLKDGDG